MMDFFFKCFYYIISRGEEKGVVSGWKKKTVRYLCPITVFLKPMSYFALMRVKCDKDRCISCGKCRRVCPMDVDVMDHSKRYRVHSLHGMREKFSEEYVVKLVTPANMTGGIHALTLQAANRNDQNAVFSCVRNLCVRTNNNQQRWITINSLGMRGVG